MTDTTILDDYIAQFSRWGMWGEDDQLGAMNLVGPEQVRAAAALVRDGKVISLTLPYDQQGPQPGGLRSNPLLVATATGTDALAGTQGGFGGTSLGDFGYSDDMVIMGTQCGTQWASPHPALADAEMPGATWFPGVRLNYAEHALTHPDDALAVIAHGQDGPVGQLTYGHRSARHVKYR